MINYWHVTHVHSSLFWAAYACTTFLLLYACPAVDVAWATLFTSLHGWATELCKFACLIIIVSLANCGTCIPRCLAFCTAIHTVCTARLARNRASVRQSSLRASNRGSDRSKFLTWLYNCSVGENNRVKVEGTALQAPDPDTVTTGGEKTWLEFYSGPTRCNNDVTVWFKRPHYRQNSAIISYRSLVYVYL